MEYACNFDEQNFDELISGFKEEKSTEKGKENFDKLMTIHQISQTFSPSNFCTISMAQQS